MTIAEAIKHATGKLTAADIVSSRLDAEVILSHVLGTDRVWLITHDRDKLDEALRERFMEAIARRSRREPLQYITGKQEFWGLEFIVTPEVLIPRPETEFLVEAAATIMRTASERMTIVDLCTGSGCVAISLAKEPGHARIIATDSSAGALDVARKNAKKLGVSDRIRFFQGDLYSPLEENSFREQVDIITANPPYIPSGDLATLQPEVKNYEPMSALVAGPEGTNIHRRIIESAPKFLKTHGALIMEMGIGQSDLLKQMVETTRLYDRPEILKDLAGIDRIIVARTI